MSNPHRIILRGCFSCRNTTPAIEHRTRGQLVQYCVRCPACRAAGSTEVTKQDAVKAWNQVLRQEDLERAVSSSTREGQG